MRSPALPSQARRFIVATVVLDVVVVGTTIAQVAALSQIVDAVLLRSVAVQALRLPIALLLASIVARSSFVGAREVMSQRAALMAKGHLRRLALTKVVELGPSFVHGESVGELVALLGNGLERLDAWIARYLPQRVLVITGPVLVGGYVILLDPLTAALLLLSAPIIPLLMVAVGSYTEDNTRAQWAALSRLSGYLLDMIQGLPTLKLLGRDREQAERVGQLAAAFRAQTMQALRQAFLSGLVLELLTMAALAVVAVELGLRLLDGTIGFGASFQALLLAPEFYRPLRELGAHRHAAMEARPVTEQVVAMQSRTFQPPVPPRAPGVPLSGSITLTFDRVMYRYPGATTPALNDVSLQLEVRTRTALVGPSGAGKSTFVHLLLRFIDPTHGTIAVNRRPLTEFDPAAWRSHVALVPQRPYFFDASALENLLLARPGAVFEEVIEATRLAGAHEFLSDFPDGYQTRLGERGVRLSHGQAQRLAIARAFLKSAALLVLDEPTSALDPESERVVRESLERLTVRTTTVVVAHRLGTAVGADQIVVLQAGEMVEKGSHLDLLASGGAYASLLQAYARAEPRSAYA